MKFTETKKVSRQDIVFSLARIPGSETLFFGNSEGKVASIDLAAEKPEAKELEGNSHTSYVTSLALAGNRLVSGSYDRHLIWWNAENGQAIRKAPAHDKWIRKVVASPDGRTVASVADDMVCRLWEAESGKLKAELKGHEPITPHHYPSMLFTCAFNRDGSLLATADKVGHIVIWDLAKLAPVQTLEAPVMYTWDPTARRHSIGGIRSLAFSPDGNVLVAGGIGKIGNIDHLGAKARMRVFAWQKGETLAEIETDKVQGLVERLEFHPEGKWLLASGGDHKGFQAVVNPGTWKIDVEEQTGFHVHDAALNEAADRFYAVGYNAINVQTIAA